MKTISKPLVLGFYGNSSSGKTTLLEKLLTALKSKNYRIAVVKISGHLISLDSEGKDTEIFSRSGADPVVLASQTTTSYLFQKSSEEVEIISNLERLSKLDCIIIEGSRDQNIPKIRLGDRAIRENTLFTYDGDYEELLNFITQLLEKEK